MICWPVENRLKMDHWGSVLGSRQQCEGTCASGWLYTRPAHQTTCLVACNYNGFPSRGAYQPAAAITLQSDDERSRRINVHLAEKRFPEPDRARS